MITEREILEDKLKNLITEYARNRKVVTNITKELLNKNLDEGFTASIFKAQTPISSVNEFVLYAICKAFFKATNEEMINPERYFTKIEIEDGDKWKQEVIIEIKDEEPIIFSPIIPINNNSWLTVKTISELYGMFNIRKLVYNVKTQRPLSVREVNGKIIERININNNSVHQIENMIIEDLFIPDPLTINALLNESLVLEVNEKNNNITFFSGELDLTDGWHRLRGMFKALSKNPSLGDYRVPIQLTRLTEERAKDYIHQKSKHNPISEKYTKTLDPNRLSNQVVEFLNTETKSLLRGKITKDSAMLKAKNSKAVVEFNTLADTIDYTFNIKEQTDLYNANKYIMNGLNHIISKLKEPTEIKIWCIYVCILYTIRDYQDWEDILDDILSNINYNIIEFKNLNKITILNMVKEINKLLPEDIEEDELGEDE